MQPEKFTQEGRFLAQNIKKLVEFEPEASF